MNVNHGPRKWSNYYISEWSYHEPSRDPRIAAGPDEAPGRAARITCTTAVWS